MKNLFCIASTEKLKSFFQKIIAGLVVTGIIWWFQMIFPIEIFSKFKAWVSWLAIIITGFIITFLLFKIRNKRVLNLAFISSLIRRIKKYYKFFIVPLLLLIFYFGLKSYVEVSLRKEINSRMDMYEDDVSFIYNTVLPCLCELIKDHKLQESHEIRGKLDTISYDQFYHANLLIKRIHKIVLKASPNNYESEHLVEAFKDFYNHYEVYRYQYSKGEISKDNFFQKLDYFKDVNIKKAFDLYLENTLEPVIFGSMSSIKRKFEDSNMAFKTFLYIETKLKDWNDNGHFQDKMDDRKVKILSYSMLSAITERGKNYDQFRIYLRNDCISSTLNLFNE